MDKIKAAMFMAAGSMATIIFQKYKEPVKKNVQKLMNKEKKMINDALEDMM